jgi:carboxyl-terminal processing protease
MVHQLLRVVGIVFFLSLTSADAAVPKLKKADVRKTMEEMFKYHVEYQRFSPLLIKRAFKVYIEQFDPERIYLLHDEVKPFLELTEAQIAAIVGRYYKDDYSDFRALDKTIAGSIKRARKWRQELERALVLNAPEPKQIPSETYAQYAKDKEELKHRIDQKVVRFLFLEKQEDKRAAWTPKRREKIFSLWERRSAKTEDPYIAQANLYEHSQTLHILKAMAKSLDAHTSYFSPEEATELRTSLEKQFEGIGVMLRESVDGVVIIDTIKGGPAAKCGQIVAGDLLVAVDGKSMVGTSYDEVLGHMKGNGSKRIRLGLKRFSEDGKEKNFDVELTREKIIMQDERLQYTSEAFGEGIIGKLTLPAFYESEDQSSCEADILAALRSLKKQGKLLGVVLDLRENSGGFLGQAVKVAGLFISSGVIVISKYARGEVQYLRDVNARVYYNGPLIVLTSKGSASAAEIVAQALQDYGVALVVGDERTYGKGSIQFQNVTDDNASAFFKVTVGKYYTVSGRSTQIEGVKADLVVPTIYSAYNIGERYLEYPLPNDRVPSAYVDPLTDISPLNRRWFQNNYLPNIQKKESSWVKMLPYLKVNSSHRLANDPNFKVFLKTLDDVKTDPNRATRVKANWGPEDLQMREAVDILKDMILLQNQT